MLESLSESCRPQEAIRPVLSILTLFFFYFMIVFHIKAIAVLDIDRLAIYCNSIIVVYIFCALIVTSE